MNTSYIGRDDALFIHDSIVGNPWDQFDESHQVKVICYCRTEDDEFIKKVEVDMYTGETKITRIPQKSSGNPSLRRQGVTIQLQSEHSQSFDLNISQHKGHTYLDTKKNNLDTDCKMY